MPIVAGVAGVDVLLLALFSVLLLYATRQLWVPFLLWLLGQVPVVGGWLDQHTAQLLAGAARWIGDRVAGLIYPLTSFVQRVESRWRELVRATLAVGQVAYNAIYHLRWVVIPWVFTTAISIGLAQVQALGRLVQGLYAASLRAIDAAVANLQAQIAQALNTAIATARALHLTALAQALSWAKTVEAEAYQWFTQSVAHAEQLTLNEAQRAQLAEAALWSTLSADVTRVEQYVRDQVWGPGGAVTTVEGDLTLGLQQTLQQALAGAAALALPLTVAIDEVKNSRCMQQCNVLGDLGEDLQALDLGVLLALLLGAATHPKEAAPALIGMLTPGGSNFAGEITGLVKG